MSTLLDVREVSVTFSGFRAVSQASVAVEAGQITAVIGPNGAGKTTLFNLITGLHRPDSGQIIFDGRDISRLSVPARCALGLLRSFQRTNVFADMPVVANVEAALLIDKREAWQMWRPARGRCTQEAHALLASVGLDAAAHKRARDLPHGDQKILDLVLALARRPKLLLLDEPTAGMSPQDTRKVIDLVERLVRERALTLFFTEHDMDVVFSISDRIVVLHHGEIVAAGEPAAVRSDPMVRRVYLGARE